MKSRPWLFLTGVIMSFTFVCRPTQAASGESDLAAAEAAVRKADADWAAGASAAGVDRWMAFYSADAIVLLPRDELVSGNDLVRGSIVRLLGLPSVLVTWHATQVKVARSGDLAYLSGTYDLRFADPQGALVADRGRLLEIWRRQADGTFKCIVNTWNSEGPTAPASAARPTFEPPPASAPVGPLAPAAGVAAKYGDKPTHYKEGIESYFQAHLKDPESIQYREITEPETGYTTAITGTLLMRESREYGWRVRATINAKNSRGRYVGFKTYTFLFRGEKILHAILPLPEDEMN